jgi:hypothetical protein
MNSLDANEAMQVLNGTVFPSLLSLVSGSTLASAQLISLIGILAVNGPNELQAVPDGDKTFWQDITVIFDQAQVMGATFQQLENVRTTIDALTLVGLPAIAVRNYCVRMCLVEQVRILADTVFTSRQQIDAYFDAINTSFGDAEEVAANNKDNVAYIALLKLHGAASNDLATRSRPLPLMTTYSYPNARPALWIAQNLYQDPSRYNELISENNPIRPLFMPTSGKALAS